MGSLVGDNRCHNLGVSTMAATNGDCTCVADNLIVFLNVSVEATLTVATSCAALR